MTHAPATEKLRAIFDTPEWARLIEKLREYRDAARPFPAAITLHDATDTERRHLAALLRRPVPSQADRLRYNLAEISAALTAAALPSDWHEIIHALRGPPPAATLAAQATAKAWKNFWTEIITTTATTSATDTFPLRREWLEALKRDGLLKRLASSDTALAAQWLETATRLLKNLPLAPDQPLAQVAAEYCADSHALDTDSPLATLVLRALALRQNQPFPKSTPERRALWAEFGVVCDELSAPVLTLNLGIQGPALLAALIKHASQTGEPLHLSTRLLWNTTWNKLTYPARVFVCENPSIVSLAARRLGPRCAPLVCVNGQYATAAKTLLRHLANAGVLLCYHGDFDTGGLAIARRIFDAHPTARPWRMNAADYLAAPKGKRLADIAALSSPWDPALANAMRQHARAIHEEAIAGQLLHDLST